MFIVFVVFLFLWTKCHAWLIRLCFNCFVAIVAVVMMVIIV